MPKPPPQGEGFACQPEAGILTSFFSQLTGEDLLALQTSCESMGASANYFIIGLNERMKSAKAWLEEGHDHEMVINLLCSGSSEA